MPLTNIEADNFTVFDDIKIPFNKGLNILVGREWYGKDSCYEISLCSMSGF